MIENMNWSCGRRRVACKLALPVILLVMVALLPGCATSTSSVPQILTTLTPADVPTASVVAADSTPSTAVGEPESYTDDAVIDRSGYAASGKTSELDARSDLPEPTPTPTLVPPPKGHDLTSGAILLETLTGPAPSFVKQQLSLGPTGGGSEGIGCNAFDLAPDQDLSRPFIVKNVSKLRTRTYQPELFYGDKWPDVCACGYQGYEEIGIDLVSPDGDILYHDTKETTPVSRKGTFLTTCLPLYDFSGFEFIPGDPLGRYTIRLVSDQGSLEHEFDLRPPERPIVYYSERLGGYVLAGFRPEETVLVLLYILSPTNVATNFGLAGTVQIEVDRYGTALVKHGDKTGDLIVLGQDGRLFIEGTHQRPSPAAFVDANRLIALYPDDPLGYYLRGKDYEVDISVRLESLSRAIELAKNPADAYAARAAIQTKMAVALEDLNSALELEPTNVTYLTSRAKTLETLGEYDAAVEDLRKLSRLARDPREPLRDLLRLHTSLGDQEAAVEDLSQMLNLETGNASLYLHRVRLNAKLGRYEEALADTVNAMVLTDDISLVLYERGQVFEAMGDEDRAIADYERALALAEDDAFRNVVDQTLQSLRLWPTPSTDETAVVVEPGNATPMTITFPALVDIPLMSGPVISGPIDAREDYGLTLVASPSYVRRSVVFLEPGSDTVSAEALAKQNCYRYELEPTESYPEPTILDHASLLRRRSYSAPHEGPDICACGFMESDRVDITLKDPTGKVVLDFEQTPYPVSRGVSNEAVYCVAVNEIAHFDFLPRHPMSEYQVIVDTARRDVTQLEHHFVLVAPDRPTLFPFDSYRSPSLVVAGLDPGEKARWLKYEVWFHQSSEYSGQGRLLTVGTLTVDENGMAVIPGMSSDYYDDYTSSVTYILGLNGHFLSHGAELEAGQFPIDIELMIAEEPSNPIGYYLRATIASDQDTASRISDLTRAIELVPDRAEFYFERGKLQADLQFAIADFSDAIARAPTEATYYFERAKALEQLQEYALAERDFNRAAQLTYNPLSQYHDRLRVHDLSGNHAGVIDVVTKMIEMQPGQGLFYIRRGQAYLAEGDSEKAHADFSFAIEFAETLGVDPAMAHFERAKIYIDTGNIEQAVADLEKVLALSGDVTLVTKALEALADLQQ